MTIPFVLWRVRRLSRTCQPNHGNATAAPSQTIVRRIPRSTGITPEVWEGRALWMSSLAGIGRVASGGGRGVEEAETAEMGFGWGPAVEVTLLAFAGRSRRPAC